MTLTRGKRFLPRVLLSLLLVTCLVFPALHAYSDKRRCTMHCFHLGKQKMKDRLETLKAELAPLPAPGMRHVVYFRFAGVQSWMRGGTFVIRSERANKVIYLGPFATDITVSMNTTLAAMESGYDILHFMLLRPDSGEMCLWSGDLGFPFWGGAKEVTIRLLSERKINKNDIVEMYEVHFDQ